MHHVVLCTKIKIRWLNEICFLWSHFISGHVLACCMPVSLYLSLSLCLSFVFLSALEDACFGSLCHVHHHQEHPHLPRGLLQLCTFRLVSLFTLYLVLVSIAASLFPCKFSSSNVFLFIGRMQLSLRTYFLSLLLIFARLSTVFVSTP